MESLSTSRKKESKMDLTTVLVVVLVVLLIIFLARRV
jgi:biopolymer transport protein ExbD